MSIKWGRSKEVIDEKKLIEALKKHFDADYGEDGRLLYSDHVCTGDDVEDIIKLIKEQPRVGESNRCVYCQDGRSLHGQKIIPTNYGWQAIKYCPNCGAKMELKELEG